MSSKNTPGTTLVCTCEGTMDARGANDAAI
jgi:hypothetical protein